MQHIDLLVHTFTLLLTMTLAVFLASSRRTVSTVSLTQARLRGRVPTRRSALQAHLQKAFSSTSAMASSPSGSESPFHTVAITGASGMFGNAIIDELLKKQDRKQMLNGKQISIVKLIRSDTIPIEDASTLKEQQQAGERTIASLKWNPNAKGTGTDYAIHPDALKSIDTVIHLAGENVGEGLLPGPLGSLGLRAWSQEKKDLILNSRVGPTQALATAIAGCSEPTSFLVASGVGVYGNDFFMADENDKDKDKERDAPDESADVSNTKGFLAEVSRQWEAASQPAADATAASPDNRIVNLRLAPIMSKAGGALGKLYPIFFLGGGGIVGSGKQYFSYISARDAARSMVHIIENDSIEGPVNVVAPTPATNADFTSALGKVLSRPTIVPLPEFAVKLMFGEMGEEMLLGGVKATPKKLMDSGFEFQHESIEKALESAVHETI
jgi:uncharacterized protein (TIGR01777 family)